MKFLKSCFNFYLNSSIHVGLELCAFVLITSFRLNFYPDFDFLAFIFFGTITGYNFIKYAALAQWHHFSLNRKLRSIQLFSLFCFIGLIVFALKLPFKTLLSTGFFGLFTLLYALPVLPRKKNLRSIESLKIFVIAIVVAGLSLAVPIIHQGISFNFYEILLFVQRVIFIIAVIIPFEIRDLNRDKAELGTIPQKIGVKKSKIMGIFLLFIFLVFEFLHPLSTTVTLFSGFLIALISGGFIIFSTRNQNKYYAAFWVDAIPIMWFLILLIAQQVLPLFFLN